MHQKLMIANLLGVHSAAKRGQARAILGYLAKLNLPISDSQRAKLLRMQKAREIQRKYKKTKVNENGPFFQLLIVLLVKKRLASL